MILTGSDSQTIRLVKIPEYFGAHEVIATPSGVMDSVEDGISDDDRNAMIESLEARFIEVEFIFDPEV